MRILRRMSFLVLASGMALAQASSGGQTQNSSVSDELKALRESIAAQQAQIAQQQKQIETLEKALAEKPTVAPHVENASLSTTAASAEPATQADVQKPKESPLSFRIGGTDFTPGGFVDFNNIFRNRNTGSVVSTGFGGIPFSNTPAGQLTEFRSTGQYSRFSLKIGGKYGANDFTGYIEADFNGNDPANVFATTNPHTLRLRQYFLNVKRGKWEFTAGQFYGLMTPNRKGVGGALSVPNTGDGNIHVGVDYSRDGQFRVAFHPNDKFSWAIATDNPQQSTNNEVALPVAFNSQGLANFVNGSGTPGVPNAFPDLVTKFAYDTKVGARDFHIEAGGRITSAKLAVQPAPVVAGTPFSKHTKIGAGFLGGIDFELTKKLRLMADGEYGTGMGRYFISLGPQFVVVPVALTPTTFDINISMVHAGSGWGGLEAQIAPKTLLGVYYGGVYYARNAFQDITSPATTKPIIGFGGVGQANPGGQNRSVQEGSLVLTQTLWKNPQYGALLLINDASYTTRSPWFVPAGDPKNAHMFMDHLVLRYIIP